MKLRPVSIEDYSALKEIHAQRDYKFDLPGLDDPLTEEALAVESETGEIIAVAFAVRTPEIVFLMNRGHPVVKLEAIRQIHMGMRESLRRKGYVFGLAMVSPKFKAFARHLKRKFGWAENFTAYRIEI
jgi:hypothetical protein